MPTWYSLLLAYGLAFGFQNKLPFLDGKSKFLDDLLKCVYCTGFHCGWMTWILTWGLTGKVPAEGGAISILASLFMWSFSSAAACYVVDTAVRWFEANTPAQE